MKAVQLFGSGGTEDLRLVEIPVPRPGPGEVLVAVKAAGVNFAEAEMVHGRYPAPHPFPFVMGFEAAGVVAALGEGVANVKEGDRIAAVVSGGSYADYALASADNLIPVPDGLTFAQAAAIPVQGVSALALLRHAARVRPGERVLIQAAAGGVGRFLVQLTRLFGAGQIIALAGSEEKRQLAARLGADVAIDYRQPGWADQVRAATDGAGVDLVLECVSGAVGEESARLLAPFGRIVVYGARNVFDTLGPDRMARLVHGNQTLTGFNLPTLRREQIADCVPELVGHIAAGRIRLLADHAFPLAEVRTAHDALLGRDTIGKVVLIP